MSTKTVYAVVGTLVGGIVAILLNLLTSGIQQYVFSHGFSIQTLWELLVLAVLGLLLGLWLGQKIQVPVTSSHHTQTTTSTPSNLSASPKTHKDTVTITRLRALLSYSKLKGQGITLSDIILIASRIDIEA